MKIQPGFFLFSPNRRTLFAQSSPDIATRRRSECWEKDAKTTKCLILLNMSNKLKLTLANEGRNGDKRFQSLSFDNFHSIFCTFHFAIIKHKKWLQGLIWKLKSFYYFCCFRVAPLWRCWCIVRRKARFLHTPKKNSNYTVAPFQSLHEYFLYH